VTSIRLRDPDPRPYYFPAGGPWDRIQTMSVDTYLRKVRPYFDPAGHPAVRPVVSCKSGYGAGLISAPVGFKPLEPGDGARFVETLRKIIEIGNHPLNLTT
jgi:hypothetical protein